MSLFFPEKSLSSTRISFEALFNESPARHSSHSTRLLQSFNFVLFNVSLKAFYLTLAVIFLDSVEPFIVSFVFVEDYGEDDELSRWKFIFPPGDNSSHQQLCL